MVAEHSSRADVRRHRISYLVIAVGITLVLVGFFVLTTLTIGPAILRVLSYLIGGLIVFAGFAMLAKADARQRSRTRSRDDQ